MTINGRCMKCKDTRDMKDVKMTMTSRGGYMAKGKCVECGCGMCKIFSKDNALAAIESGDAVKDF